MDSTHTFGKSKCDAFSFFLSEPGRGYPGKKTAVVLEVLLCQGAVTEEIANSKGAVTEETANCYNCSNSQLSEMSCVSQAFNVHKSHSIMCRISLPVSDKV